MGVLDLYLNNAYVFALFVFNGVVLYLILLFVIVMCMFVVNFFGGVIICMVL